MAPARRSPWAGPANERARRRGRRRPEARAALCAWSGRCRRGRGPGRSSARWGGGGARGGDAQGFPRPRRRRRRRGHELAPRRAEPERPGPGRRGSPSAARTMAAQGEPGYLAAQSDPGSNSERSTDSPVAGSEDDLVAAAPLHSPEWSEERFRVDRKKLEAMLQGRHAPAPDLLLRAHDAPGPRTGFPPSNPPLPVRRIGGARGPSLSCRPLSCHSYFGDASCSWDIWAVASPRAGTAQRE